MPPGGHKNTTHVDRGALEYLHRVKRLQTMVDVGCATGGQVGLARELGMLAVGVDGDPDLLVLAQPMFILHDYRQGPLDIGPFDLGWCVEFLEHVEERYLPNVFSTLGNCLFVCCTHATKPTKNELHVNVQPEDYWIEKFRQYGFELDRHTTEQVRARSTMKREFMRQTGKVFRKRVRTEKQTGE